MPDAADLVLTFLSGIVSGLFIQHVTFKYSLRKEKLNRLFPYLESAYPIVDRLSRHSEYAAKTQLQDDRNELPRILEKVTSTLNEYSQWFNELMEDGMIPELDSIDRKLLNHLSGLFNYARLCQFHGQVYLSEQIQNLSKYCTPCRTYLAHRLSR